MRRKLMIAALLAITLLLYGRPKRPVYETASAMSRSHVQETISHPPDLDPEADIKALSVLGVIAGLAVFWLVRREPQAGRKR